MPKNDGSTFIVDAMLESARKRQNETENVVPNILADAMRSAAEEIDHLRAELSKAADKDGQTVAYSTKPVGKHYRYEARLLVTENTPANTDAEMIAKFLADMKTVMESKPVTWQEEQAAVEDAFARSGVTRTWPNDEPDQIIPMVNAMADQIQRLWELVNGMAAAIETAGFVYRNTDSGPNLVRGF